MKKQLDRFTVQEPIGMEDATQLYKAEEPLPGGNRRQVVLYAPVSSSDKNTETRFHNLVKLYATLGTHARIGTMVGAGMTEGQPWLASAYYPTLLSGKIADISGNPTDIARLLMHIAEALITLHTVKPQILANDIQPDNIGMDNAGNFALLSLHRARLGNQDNAASSSMIPFSAPELLSSEFGQPDATTDLYALGHLAYHFALGNKQHRYAFPVVYENTRHANANKWMAWHCSFGNVAPALSELDKKFPSALSDVIAKLIAKPRDRRIQSALDLHQQLRSMTGALPATASTIPSATALANPVRPGMPQMPGMPVRPGLAPMPGMPMRPGMPAAPAMDGAPASVAPSGSYYVRLRGRVTGPYDVATLQRQAKQGLLSRMHQLSSDQVNWVNSPEVEGIF
ncbi:MAG: hypothetical protein WCJ97_10120 [Phycisphaerae bacterium]